MSSPHSSLFAGETYSLSMTTPVLLMSVKSCAAVVDVLELLLDVLELLVVFELFVAFAAFAGLAFELLAAGAPQAVKSAAAAATHKIRTYLVLIIFSFFLKFSCSKTCGNSKYYRFLRSTQPGAYYFPVLEFGADLVTASISGLRLV